MNLFKNFFGKTSASSPFAEFSKLSPNDRLKQIMILGNEGDIKNFALISYAIQTDPDMGVRMAGLKRIHNFKNHPDVKPLLLKMRESKTSDRLEPYFSMALSRTGIITLEEFKKKING